jgi:hypothetical protein
MSDSEQELSQRSDDRLAEYGRRDCVMRLELELELEHKTGLADGAQLDTVGPSSRVFRSQIDPLTSKIPVGLVQ